jgi:uncharacterized protein involved in exopolysaccharide biosynthesis
MNVQALSAEANPGAPARSLSDRMAALRRRARSMSVAFIIFLVATVATALLWPATYESTGIILIEQQEMPVEYVRAPISSYADQRVQTISQRVMTSSNLMSIITKFDLYRRERSRKPREVVIQHMRDDIELEMISADVVDPRQGRATKATIAFSVSYRNRSPELAAQVANELTSLYLSENMESRQRLAASSADFLADEAEKIRTRIADLDKRIADFKELHGDKLPEYTQLNIQLMNRTEDEMRDTDMRVRSLDQQIVYLQSQLIQIDPASQLYSEGGARVLSQADRLKVLRTQYTSARAVYGPTHPDVVRMEQEIQGLEVSTQGADNVLDLQRRITDWRSELAVARERYSASHPDVQRLDQLIAGAEQDLQSAPAASRAPTKAATPDNPAYIQIKAQLEAASNERTSLLAQRAQLQARSREFEQNFAQTPGIERDYSGMLRDLQGEQIKYAEVRQKQMEAQLASNLETESKGERFQLIEPPLEPQRPASPNRVLILALGLVLALSASGGTMATLEAVDTRVRGRDDILALLNVAPLAIVPWSVSAADRAASRRRRLLILLICMLLAAGALVAVHMFVRPLDLLWFSLLRRLG